MSMSNRVVLNNGDVLRVVKNNSRIILADWVIQAKQKDKNNYTMIGKGNTLPMAIEEMNCRAKIINEKGYIV